MIKLVLSDMDNTLVAFGHNTASQRTIDAIHACQEQGVNFGPASGRDRAELASFFNNDASCYNTGVLVNGQKIYYLSSLIKEILLDEQELRRAADIVCTTPGSAFIVYRPNGIGDWVGISRTEMAHMYERAFMAGGEQHLELPSYPCAKAGIICMLDNEGLQALKARLTEACPNLVFPNTVVNWLDISPRGVSKADGVHVLMKTLRLKPEEVCVFGDADNDLEMLQAVPHSCAVANANERVKALARWHVGASADEGVAIALEQIAEAARLCNESGREDIMPAFMSE